MCAFVFWDGQIQLGATLRRVSDDRISICGWTIYRRSFTIRNNNKKKRQMWLFISQLWLYILHSQKKSQIKRKFLFFIAEKKSELQMQLADSERKKITKLWDINSWLQNVNSILREKKINGKINTILRKKTKLQDINSELWEKVQKWLYNSPIWGKGIWIVRCKAVITSF